MPFNLQVQPRMGDYTLMAAQSVSQGIRERRKKAQEQEEKLGEADALYTFGTKKGWITPEEQTKYIGANANQKASMAAGWAKRMAFEQVDAHYAQEEALARAQMANAVKVAQIHAAASGAGRTPGLTAEQVEAQRQIGWRAGYELLTEPAPGGGFTVKPIPYKGGEGEQFTPPSKTIPVTDSQGRIIDVVPTSKGQVTISPYSSVESKAPVHTPGETYFDPNTGEAKGVWGAGDHPVIFAEGEPLKKELAARLKAAREAQQKGGAAKQKPTTAGPTPQPTVVPQTFTAPAGPGFGLQLPGTPGATAAAPAPATGKPDKFGYIPNKSYRDPVSGISKKYLGNGQWE
jgi:hypothetical protein